MSLGTPQVVMSSCYDWPKENLDLQIYKSKKERCVVKAAFCSI